MITDPATPQRSNVTTKRGPREVALAVKLDQRRTLQEYFLDPDDVADFGSFLAVLRPFESPLFESRMCYDMDKASIMNIFTEIVSSTLGCGDFLDVSLPNSPGRTYGNVLEDLITLILVANCGVAVPDNSTKKETLHALAKNMLLYEKVKIRKAYLEKLMINIPSADYAVYKDDFYQRYKYDKTVTNPLPLKEYIDMRHQKKMAHYLCQCSLSWSFVFTGVPQEPLDMEPSTILPKYQATEVPRNIIYVVTSPDFQQGTRGRLPPSHLLDVVPRGFLVNYVVESGPIEIPNEADGSKSSTIVVVKRRPYPAPAVALQQVAPPVSPPANAPVPVPPQAAPHQAQQPPPAPAAAAVPPPIVPADQNVVRFAAWLAKNKNDYETNKSDGVTRFSSFPTDPLQINSEKRRHIELGTVYHRSVEDDIVVVTGRAQMNDCKFHKAVIMGKYPSTYSGTLTQLLRASTNFQGIPACHVFDHFPTKMTNCPMYADFTGVCAETQRPDVSSPLLQ